MLAACEHHTSTGRPYSLLATRPSSNLLSPHRTPQGQPDDHDGRIVTDQPNEMWGTDGARFQTVEDGWVWGFFAVDHFNAECVGWHVSKWGTRFAALEPIAMGLTEHFGSSEAGAGAALALRMDHGTQYTSEDFRQQLKAWGIRPSFAYVAEPETNGVAERFIRTLKKQVIYGRIYRNLEGVRRALQQPVAGRALGLPLATTGPSRGSGAGSLRQNCVREIQTATSRTVEWSATAHLECPPARARLTVD